MKRPDHLPDLQWQSPSETCCDDMFPRAVWLTLVAMLANLPAMIRYIRTGQEPS